MNIKYVKIEDIKYVGNKQKTNQILQNVID